jgi:prepilin-type N-terminal cleavage/methylation domain-containing protein
MHSKQSGFTLVELLVVIGMIGILAAVAMPQLAEYRQRGFDGRSVQDLRHAALGEEAYFADNERYVDCIGGASCKSLLPAFEFSSGVDIAMYEVPAAGASPTHFTGRSFHVKGTKNSLINAFMWDSSAGGLQ